MITAIRAELLKIRTTRLTAGLLGVAAGLTVLVIVLEISQSGTGAGGATSIPALSTVAGLRAILTNTGFAMLVATVFGATVSSGEFRHRTATDTYLDEPNRVLVLTAKIISAMLVGALFGLIATALTTSGGLAAAAAKGVHIVIGAGDIATYAAGAIAGAALMAGAGVAVGALIRGQLGALIVVFVWAMAVEQILSRVWPSLGRFLPLLAATTMAGANSMASMPPVPPTLHPLAPGAVALVLAGVVLALAVTAALTSLRRDVT
jgi:ABC-type transport system involved in multi-copper enzyme maturation permease subunit